MGAMEFFQRNIYFVLGWIAFALLAAPAVTFAQTDEIQVYDAEIEDQGKFNLMFQRNIYFVLGWIAFALLAAPAVTFAQTDEIQVYDAEIEDQGKFNLMIHS